jgi:hypothetical protein
MAKFSYAPREGDPESTTVMRVDFPAGTAVDVDENTEMGAALAAKLRQNPWFEEGDKPAEEGDQPAEKEVNLDQPGIGPESVPQESTDPGPAEPYNATDPEESAADQGHI